MYWDMDEQNEKICAICGTTVPPQALGCAECGGGVFKTEKSHSYRGSVAGMSPGAFRHTTSDSFEEFSKRTIDNLASRYGEYVHYLIKFARLESAIAFLGDLSFSDSNFITPDHIQAAVSANREGGYAFLVLGGQLTADENEEIRSKAFALGVTCTGGCVAANKSKVLQEFMVADARLKGAGRL